MVPVVVVVGVVVVVVVAVVVVVGQRPSPGWQSATSAAVGQALPLFRGSRVMVMFRPAPVSHAAVQPDTVLAQSLITVVVVVAVVVVVEVDACVRVDVDVEVRVEELLRVAVDVVVGELVVVADDVVDDVGVSVDADEDVRVDVDVAVCVDVDVVVVVVHRPPAETVHSSLPSEQSWTPSPSTWDLRHRARSSLQRKCRPTHAGSVRKGVGRWGGVR